MMDVPASNQSQSFSQPWAGLNGWSTASPPGALCGPLPGFQHLTLGSPSDQTARHDLGAVSPEHNAHQGGPSPEQPPFSTPLKYDAGNPRQVWLYSPLSPRPAVPAPFDHPYQPQAPGAPGPQPQVHLPISPPDVPGPRHVPPLFDGVNVESAGGPPASPIQQQPQWTLPSCSGGGVTQFPPDAAAQERSPALQSPTLESRYGLDPELLPSAVKVMAEDQAEWQGKVFVSEPFSHLPPLATTSCVIEDRGNASPRAVRSTSYCVPCEGHAALLSRLPLGALVTPLVKHQAEEKPLPLCSEQECIAGCRWCGAAMCPAMAWQDCGQRFYCPFCGKLSEVPWQQFQPTRGASGGRVDEENRPELHLGSYEILSSQEGAAAALLFAIDVSSPALRGGHLEFVTQQIHTLLSSLLREDSDAWRDVCVGLMTYDSRVHLYDLSPSLFRPHMLVITETEDLQLPVREGLLVALRDCMDSIDSVFNLIPQFGPEEGESSGAPVEMPVKAGLAVLQTLNRPGKLLIFHTAPPQEVPPTQASSGFFGTHKPKSIFEPPERALSLAKECVGQGCGVHLFVLAQQDVGGAWPGHVPYLTGGALYAYSHLQGELDRERFSTDLRRIIETTSGFKAELRVFVSKDLRVSGCYGPFVPGPSPSRVTMATLDRRTTVAVELAHSRALDEARGVAIQAVLTYSSQSGRRRVRVHTLTLRCSRHLQDTFRHCQAQTLLTFYCKKMYCAALERPLHELREELQTESTELLASYRKHCCSAAVSAGQLVLPQHLRALPVYINSLRKSEVLLPGLRSSVHQRVLLRCQVLSMDTVTTVTHFYPLLLPLDLLPPQLLKSPAARGAGVPRPGEALRCCAASLQPSGVYLLAAPHALLLWIGARAPPRFLAEIFGGGCFSSLLSGETKLPELDNPTSAGVRSLVAALNASAPCARQLWLVKQGDACEEPLQRHLVEDKSQNGGASYADFLYHLHFNSVRLLQ